MLTTILSALFGSVFKWLDAWITRKEAEKARDKAKALEALHNSMKEAGDFEGRCDRILSDAQVAREKADTLDKRLEALKEYNA